MQWRNGDSKKALLRQGVLLVPKVANIFIEGAPSFSKDKLTRALVRRLCAPKVGFGYLNLMEDLQGVWSLVDHITTMSKALSRMEESNSPGMLISDHLLFFLSRAWEHVKGASPLVKAAKEIPSRMENTLWVLVSEKRALGTSQSAMPPVFGMPVSRTHLGLLEVGYRAAADALTASGVNLLKVCVEVEVGNFTRSLRNALIEVLAAAVGG